MGLDKSACANQSQKLLDDGQTGGNPGRPDSRHYFRSPDQPDWLFQQARREKN